MAQNEVEKKSRSAEWLLIAVVLLLAVGFTTVVGKVFEFVGMTLPTWGWLVCWIAACAVGFTFLEPRVYSKMGLPLEEATPEEIEEYRRSQKPHSARPVPARLKVMLVLQIAMLVFLVWLSSITSGFWSIIMGIFAALSVLGIAAGIFLIVVVRNPARFPAVVEAMREMRANRP